MHEDGSILKIEPSCKELGAKYGRIVFTAILTGLGGAFTPCTLGVNLIMIKYLSGKSRTQRLFQWTQFAVSRAAMMAVLGLVIMSAEYRSIYYPIIGGLLIVLGLAEIALPMYVIPSTS